MKDGRRENQDHCLMRTNIIYIYIYVNIFTWIVKISAIYLRVNVLFEQWNGMFLCTNPDVNLLCKLSNTLITLTWQESCWQLLLVIHGPTYSHEVREGQVADRPKSRPHIGQRSSERLQGWRRPRCTQTKDAPIPFFPAECDYLYLCTCRLPSTIRVT